MTEAVLIAVISAVQAIAIAIIGAVLNNQRKKAGTPPPRWQVWGIFSTAALSAIAAVLAYYALTRPMTLETLMLAVYSESQSGTFPEGLELVPVGSLGLTNYRLTKQPSEGCHPAAAWASIDHSHPAGASFVPSLFAEVVSGSILLNASKPNAEGYSYVRVQVLCNKR